MLPCGSCRWFDGLVPDATSSLHCPHFGDCGGCTCLTTPIAIQRAQKISSVMRILGDHVRHLELSFTDRPTETPRHHRMRILYPVQPSGDSLALGLYRQGTHEIVELQSCEIQHPALTELGRRAATIFRDRHDTPYDEGRHRGALRAFTARLAPTTGELLLGVVTATAELQDPASLAAALMTAATDLPTGDDPLGGDVRPVGVVHNVNPDRGNALIGATVQTLTGLDHVREEVADLVFRLSFLSFHQLHRHADALLYRPALAMLGSLAGASVVDAYGGVGAFALRIARAGAASVTLVESHPSACADARHNAAANGIDIKVVEAPFDAVDLPTRPDLLIVDPTRAGLRSGGCARVRSLDPARVLYVSCGLKALARDLTELPGYVLEEARLSDLFPHTDHVEVLASLRRR